eukprot:SAG11_NODE_1973_length_3979_cov_5.654897_2_plen_87_part_00
MADAILLIMANKQDIEGAMGVVDVSHVLQLAELAAERRWFIQPCSAVLVMNSRRVCAVTQSQVSPGIFRSRIHPFSTIHSTIPNNK